MRCLPQKYLNVENYLSTVKKLELQWEEWCVIDNLKHDVKVTTGNIVGLELVSKNSPFQLAMDILSKTNVTLSHRDAFDCRCHRHVQIIFNSASPPGLGMLDHWGKNVELIFTHVEGYKFLTCHAEPYISFDFYLSPYQTELWVVLGISICTIIAIMTLVHNFHRPEEKQPFSAWLFVLASLFEETGFLSSKIERATFFRILIGIWSIMSVILTNGYNGIMISELNSPRQLSHPENFEDLVCQNKFKNNQFKSADTMGLSDSEEQQYQDFIRVELWKKANSMWMIDHSSGPNHFDRLHGQNTCYKLLSKIQHHQYRQTIPEFLSVLVKLAQDYILSFNFNPKTEIFKDLNLFDAEIYFYPSGFSYITDYISLQGIIEREVVQCGKTVFIAKSSELEMEYNFLARKYPRTKFFVSDQEIQVYPSGISFQFPFQSRVVRGFKSVVATGIWNHAENEELNGKNFNRTPAIVMDQSTNIILTNIATLNGALPTVFVLAGCLISVTILIFVIERWFFVSSVARLADVFRRSRKPRRKPAKSKVVVVGSVSDTDLAS
ncbi:Glutamate receptor 4 [Folsomia candida]|uniref:Glutamate receptor 4 n=1 Tax=Folsomia candida TaxID=158441 RepID=A0A226DUX7_FOLCA|nr:Glutamate receptor 4 [Folsomia candida]